MQVELTALFYLFLGREIYTRMTGKLFRFQAALIFKLDGMVARWQL